MTDDYPQARTCSTCGITQTPRDFDGTGKHRKTVCKLCRLASEIAREDRAHPRAYRLPVPACGVCGRRQCNYHAIGETP